MGRKAKVAASTDAGPKVLIPAPNLKVVVFDIEGDAPLVIHNFGAKAEKEIAGAQELGSVARTKKVHPPKDFDALCNDARHISTDGWDGFPSKAIRESMIAACRLIDFTMTDAKQAITVLPDGYSKDGTPLTKIIGKWHRFDTHVRLNDGKPDIRTRPRWDVWSARIKLRFDADKFSIADMANLLSRAGAQCGIMEGRPNSKKSSGMGWGTFFIKGSKNG